VSVDGLAFSPSRRLELLRRRRVAAQTCPCAAELSTGRGAHATQTPPEGKSWSTRGCEVWFSRFPRFSFWWLLSKLPASDSPRRHGAGVGRTNSRWRETAEQRSRPWGSRLSASLPGRPTGVAPACGGDSTT